MKNKRIPIPQNLSSSSSTSTDKDRDAHARPVILIFDSGVGGLSVYYEIRKLLPDLCYIYAFDNDAFPYGEKSEEFIIQRTVRVIDKIQKKHDLSIAVIACNTATTVSLHILRMHFKFPIIGVVPALKLATKLTTNGIIGLLATNVTINGQYIKQLIEQVASEDYRVEMIASPELVILAEKKIHGKNTSKKALRDIIKPWLRVIDPPDTIVLGCTHFTFLAKELKELFYINTQLIHSCDEIANRTNWLINNYHNLIYSKSKNIAYCTNMNYTAKKLLPLLINKGLNNLKMISI